MSGSDEVLEVGPGKGILTRLLAASASRVVAIEIDQDLAQALPSRVRYASNVEVLNQDALEVSPSTVFDGEYKLVANLPYYVATPLIRMYLRSDRRPTSMVVMVQKEVAEAITASPGRMSLLSVQVQLFGAARFLFSVPPRAFRPRPKVTSAVVRIDPYDAPVVPTGDPDAFLEFVAAGFRAPRKQIRNSLALGLDAETEPVKEVLRACGVDGRRRPATLDVPEWAALFASWNEGV